VYGEEAAYASGAIAERWSYLYDDHGRKHVASRSVANTSGGFSTVRVEQTVFDSRGRITAEVTPEGTLSYTFDNQGRMSSVAVSETLTSPVSRVTRYSYDILGRLASVQEDSTPSITTDATLDTEHTFDLQGRADTTTMPNGVTTDYDFDALGRLDTQTDTNAAGQTLASYDYTVRADGKRTSLDETHWLDANTDGVRQPSEVKGTAYDWTYDAAGRLTDEAITHFDTSISQSEKFTYDLTGNRTKLERNHDGVAGIDEAITYNYDVNDRLLTEFFDDKTSANADTTTTYGYDHTQQTSKIVTDERQGASLRLSAQLFTYNLQGRMSAVINDSYTNGNLSSRERTSYQYNSGSYRVHLITETGTTLSANAASETWSLKSETSFLADSHNHTGYTQTIRETKVENGHTLITDYTFGNDEILQRVHGTKADGTSVDDTLIFGHDGHGSVRYLSDLTGLINQVATYASYGAVLAVHNAMAQLVGTSESSFRSTLGYSGEAWDTNVQQQYLRARFYNPANGRFDRLDDFQGKMQDPQSLHKYAYVHGDPIQGIDPTGESIFYLLYALNATVATIGTISAGLNLRAAIKQVEHIHEATSIGSRVGFFVHSALFALHVGLAALGIASVIRALSQDPTAALALQGGALAIEAVVVRALVME
jgi:RHS repeat-associated protein